MDALRCPPGDTPIKVSPAEKDAAWRSAASCFRSRTSFSWTSRRTIWTRRPWPGSNSISSGTRERLSPSRTTGIFSTTWPVGFSNWTGGEGIPWKGNYSSWLEQKQIRLAQEGKAESDRQKTLQRELEWVRMAPRARQAKSKARVQAYEKLLSQESERPRRSSRYSSRPAPRLGGVVIQAENVVKAYGDNILMDKMSFSLPPGGIVGVVGPNGAGKTTLFRMITREESRIPGRSGLVRR